MLKSGRRMPFIQIAKDLEISQIMALGQSHHHREIA